MKPDALYVQNVEFYVLTHENLVLVLATAKQNRF